MPPIIRSCVAILNSIADYPPGGSDSLSMCLRRLLDGGLAVSALQVLSPGSQDGNHAWPKGVQGRIVHNAELATEVQEAIHANGCTPNEVLILNALKDDDSGPLLPGAYTVNVASELSKSQDLGSVIRALAQRQAQADGPGPPCRLVAYAMTQSREAALAALGLFCLVPKDGLVFAPLDLGLSLGQQWAGPLHAVLHKASDELQESPGGGVEFSPRVAALRRELATARADVAVIDPIECAEKVIDRQVLCTVLDGLATSRGAQDDGPQGDTARGPSQVIRGPRWALLAAGASGQERGDALRKAGLSPPYIVKPAVACGISSSHNMALVLRHITNDSALAGADVAGEVPELAVPLPAVAQEFVNHGGLQVKAYVIGDEVFSALRSSIPDLPASPLQQCAAGLPAVLHFNSLSSLPTSLPGSAPVDPTNSPPPPSSLLPAAVTPTASHTAPDIVPQRVSPTLPHTSPQPVPPTLPHTAPHTVPQPTSHTVPHTTPQPVSSTVPHTALHTKPQPVSHTVPKVASHAASYTSSQPAPHTSFHTVSQPVSHSPSHTPSLFHSSPHSPLHPVSQAALREVAAFLRGALGLTLFGFDVVVGPGGNAVVIDVNYFPSYKGCGEVAAPFRRAVNAAVQQHREAREGKGGGGGADLVQTECGE